jgi:hypothetical protein
MADVIALLSMSLDGFVADGSEGSPTCSTGTSRAR